MTGLNQFRQQLESVRDDLKRQCAALKAQLSDKAARLDALNILLDDEVTSAPPTLFPENEEPAEENLTTRAKEVMREAGARGVKPRDITRILRQKGLDVKNTFASNFLWRMKTKTNEAVQIKGKYYWKGFEPGVNHRL